MKLDEAIAQFKEDAENNRADLDILFAEENEQIAAWLIELEQYHAIGTVEEIIRKLAELDRWHTSEVNPDIKNVFANVSTQICHNCDHKDEYIVELEAEIEQYREIGTVEECREAAEKQKPKSPDYEGDGYADGQLVYDTWICPCCGKRYEVDYDNYDYCPNCGQHIDKSMEQEGER